MCATGAADRGFTWSEEETNLLLKLWGANDAQSELTGNKRNFVVYEKISEKMGNAGFLRTASQCREKIKRMKREYTLTKKYNSRTGGPKKKMKFYKEFEQILLEKQNQIQKNSSPTESANQQPEMPPPRNSEWELFEKSTECAFQNESDKLLSLESKAFGNAWSPDVLLVEGKESPLENRSPASTHSEDGISRNANSLQRRKRKMSSKISFFQSMMESLTLKFMKYQNESDTRFLDKIEQLELERIKMDEKIHKMWLDFEDRRRTNEREHEINVMAVFNNIMKQVKNNEKSNDV